MPVSRVVPGTWDVVCPIVEWASPEGMVAEAGHEDFEHAAVGDQTTGRLFEGESGLIVINLERREYALFLVYGSDKIVVGTNGGKTAVQQCLPFSTAILKNHETRWPEWTYLTLENDAQ